MTVKAAARLGYSITDLRRSIAMTNIPRVFGELLFTRVGLLFCLIRVELVRAAADSEKGKNRT